MLLQSFINQRKYYNSHTAKPALSCIFSQIIKHTKKATPHLLGVRNVKKILVVQLPLHNYMTYKIEMT